MMDRQLKKELEKITIPMHDAHKLEDTITNAIKLDMHPENLRMTNVEFFFNQLHFIRKKTWILKICFSIFMLYLLITESMDAGNWIWTFIAISGPALCLINANEICNVFQTGLLEVQMTAKNSFRKVLVIRLSVFGIFDLIFFVCVAAAMSAFKDTIIWQVILYGTVPYEIMCFGCMYIINRCREENMILYSGVWGVCLSCIIVILKIYETVIYETYHFGTWAVIGAVALSGIRLELKKLLKKAGGNLSEINYGAVI